MRRADHLSRGVLWMFVCCECCVLSGRGLCDGLITRPEESYGCLSVVSVVCCQVEVSASGRSIFQRSPTECGVYECNCVFSTMWRPWPTRDSRAVVKKKMKAELTRKAIYTF